VTPAKLRGSFVAGADDMSVQVQAMRVNAALMAAEAVTLSKPGEGGCAGADESREPSELQP